MTSLDVPRMVPSLAFVTLRPAKGWKMATERMSTYHQRTGIWCCCPMKVTWRKQKTEKASYDGGKKKVPIEKTCFLPVVSFSGNEKQTKEKKWRNKVSGESGKCSELSDPPKKISWMTAAPFRREKRELRRSSSRGAFGTRKRRERGGKVIGNDNKGRARRTGDDVSSGVTSSLFFSLERQ